MLSIAPTLPLDNVVLGQYAALTQDLLAVVAVDGALKAMNPAWGLVFDLQAATVAPPDLLACLHPDERTAFTAALTAARSGGVITVDARLQCLDGSYRSTRWQLTRAPQSDAVILVGADRTLALRVAELESRASLLQTIIDTTPQCLKLLSADGVLLEMNPSGLAMIDAQSLDQVAGNCVYPLVAEPYRQAFQDSVAATFRGETVQLDFAITSLKGKQRWLSTQTAPLYGADGTITAMLGITQDITARKELDLRLRQVEVMVENAPDGFSLTELDGRIIYLNPAFQAMLGYPANPAGAPFLQFIAEHEHARIPQLMQVVQTEGSWQGSITYRRANGSHFDAQLTAFVVRDATGAPVGLAGIARDRTEEQQRERERQALQEQVIAAQQAALRELSTPLIPIAAGVVAMPLIGSIDSSRAQLVLETLLEGVALTRATTAILDITGVPVVDAQVANALLRAAQAVRLLGAQVVLTGIRPEVAQTLVGLGADMSGIVTRATLQSGIALGLGHG